MIRNLRVGRIWVGILGGLGATLLVAGGAQAQGAGIFGGQARADAASQMLVLAVQQGISSLPPTAGQSFSYRFDPVLLTQVPDEGRLEPVSFRSTQLVSPGVFSLRAAASYFELDDTFGPILYRGEATNPNDVFEAGVTEFGTRVAADVLLANIAANYGAFDRFEVSVNVPLVSVNARASQTYLTFEENVAIPVDQVNVGAAPDLASLEQLKELGRDPSIPDDGLAFRNDSLRSLGFKFNSGRQFGVGRISLGGKYLVYTSEVVQLAASTELFLPSPNEREFAGSESFALLPRLIGRAGVHEMLRLHADVGYDLDFENDELSRFVWNAGASIVPVTRLVLDAGFGGSVFAQKIRWTPISAQSPGDAAAGIPPLTIHALRAGETQLGSNFFDFLAGAKVKATEMLILSGSVSVPINDDGFRPDVVGTLSAELYF